jgi:hypothetical protein
MNQISHPFARTLLVASAMIVSLAAQARQGGDQNVPPATAQKQAAEIARGDPPRWHQEDATMAARLKTIRKEIAAGLQENLGACKSQPAAERSACVRDARSIYQQEMAGAKARAASGE